MQKQLKIYVHEFKAKTKAWVNWLGCGVGGGVRLGGCGLWPSLGLGCRGQSQQHVLDGAAAQLLIIADLRKEAFNIPYNAMMRQLLRGIRAGWEREREREQVLIRLNMSIDWHSIT